MKVLTLEELQRRHIIEVLEMCNQNSTHAARLLGIDRRSLYRWIAKIRIS